MKGRLRGAPRSRAGRLGCLEAASSTSTSLSLSRSVSSLVGCTRDEVLAVFAGPCYSSQIDVWLCCSAAAAAAQPTLASFGGGGDKSQFACRSARQ